MPGVDTVTLCAFDLLIQDGSSLMGLPLESRKKRLEALLAGRAAVLVVKDLPCDARLFAEVVEPLSLEGFVAKRKGSAYLPGVVSPDGGKIKRKGWQKGRSWKP
jgi:ATP-dependent DNA ligase